MYAIGINASSNSNLGSGQSNKDLLLQYGQDFRNLAKNLNLKLYLQNDMRFDPIDYRRHYGEDTYLEFLALKNKFDPKHIFNRGSIFPYLKNGANGKEDKPI